MKPLLLSTGFTQEHALAFGYELVALVQVSPHQLHALLVA